MRFDNKTLNLAHTREIENIKLDINLKTKDYNVNIEKNTRLEGRLTILNRDKVYF